MPCRALCCSGQRTTLGQCHQKVLSAARKASLLRVLTHVCSVTQIFCLHGGLSPTLDTLDHIRALDRVQEVRQLARTSCDPVSLPGAVLERIN